MDRAGHDADGNVFVGLNRTEGFGDALQFDGWGMAVAAPKTCRPVFAVRIHAQKLSTGQLSSDM